MVLVATVELGNETVFSEITAPEGAGVPEIVGSVPADVIICVVETISIVTFGGTSPGGIPSTFRMANPGEPAAVLLDISMLKKLL